MKCIHINVPEDVCSICFNDNNGKTTKHIVHNSIDIGKTIRGEDVIVHYTDDHRIIEIELVSTKLKPCMKL